MRKLFTLALVGYLSSFFAFALSPEIPQQADKGKEKGHEWVDLGLSVKWATCNIGARKPSDYGKYYSWGETSTKKNYYDYKWGRHGYYTKYCTNSAFGVVDNRITLEMCDDAARVNWGGNWRMPTAKEFMELCNRCTWEWTTIKGHNGYLVTGPNGNSIFLPAAGTPGTHTEGEFGNYWSSSLVAALPVNASDLWFCDRSYMSRQNSCYREPGKSIRPVLEFEDN